MAEYYVSDFISFKIKSNINVNYSKSIAINGENKNFTKDLSCEVRSIEEIITKVPGCPSSMRSIEYGYTNPLTRFSYVIGESCYSTEKGKTIFVHTKLRESKTDSSEISLKKIEHENYFRGVHPSSFWKIDFMKAARVDEMEKTLKSLLGTEKVPVLGIKKFIGDEFLTHKQFQAVLRLTWNNFISYDEEVLENFDLLQQDILGLGVKNVEIYTGGHGVLSWKNDEGKSVEIYLREGKYPVPNFIWTVVKSDDKATAFAVSNNPMLTADEIEANTFCKSKCDKITWITNLLNEEKYKNGKNGFVLCCALNDFRSTVTEMPELVDVVGMFK